MITAKDIEVFILTYNRCNFLEESLTSLLNQTVSGFDIIVIDLGNEFLQAKISLNNREKYNNIKSNFYLPITQKAKLMFCGEGNNIKITELEIKSFIKYDENREKFDLILSDERKACDCCLIG